MWIEITVESALSESLQVTPYAGVWIEIKNLISICADYIVTPYAGVWIEIGTNKLFDNYV